MSEARKTGGSWSAALVVATLGLAAACTEDAGGDAMDSSGEAESSGSADSSTGSALFDQAQVIARARAYATELVQVNAEARASEHGLAESVNVWVDEGAMAAYVGLDPAMPSTTAAWDPGALLVKEHLDADGAVDGLTVMAQGDPLSASGGWWWARLGPGDETFETGEVGFCVNCHMRAADRGWAFGVPLDNRR